MLLYLPDPTGSKNDILPPHEFFWTTLFTLYYDQANGYIDHVEQARKQMNHKLNQPKELNIPMNKIDELLKYEYEPKKKSKRQPGLFQKKAAKQARKERMARQRQIGNRMPFSPSEEQEQTNEAEEDILRPPQGGNMKV